MSLEEAIIREGVCLRNPSFPLSFGQVVKELVAAIRAGYH
jgi:hypothetical protein